MKSFIALFAAVAALNALPALGAGNALTRAADGAEFQIGSTPYRVVSSARAVKAEPTGQNADRSVAARAPAEQTVGNVGPYAIQLGAPSNTARGAPASPDYLVVVNRRSGKPALLTSKLKIYGVDAGTAASLAASSGGATVLVVPPAAAILDYASPAAALAAMAMIRDSKRVSHVEPEVISAFATPR